MFILRSIFKSLKKPSAQEVESKKQLAYASFNNIMFSLVVDLIILTLFFKPVEQMLSNLFLDDELVGKLLKEATNEKNILELDSLLTEGVFSILFDQGLYLQYLFIWLVNMLIFLAYFVFFYYKFQSTPGQMLISYKLVDENGKKPSLLKLLSRCILGFFSAIIFFLGFFMAAFGKKKQTMHDRLVGSYIIKK